jgi:DNA-binding transcriptional LysR family regulator
MPTFDCVDNWHMHTWALKRFFMIDPAALPALHAFVTVAERRSFTAAAAVLRVSPSAVSQAVRRLEREVGTTLLARTTRSVRPTDAGIALLERAGPALREAIDALEGTLAGKGAIAGRLRLTVPRIAVPMVITPALPRLLKAHPALDLEISVDDRLVDIVAEGFDAGVRLSESLEADMVGIRLTDPFRFVVVGSPRYLREHGAPAHPRDLARHACIGYRGQTSGVLYRWEFEHQKKEIAIAVTGRVTTNDAALMVQAARDGLGLAYVDEPSVAADLKSGRLRVVLEPYSAAVPGFFLCCPTRSRDIPKLRAFVEAARRA